MPGTASSRRPRPARGDRCGQPTITPEFLKLEAQRDPISFRAEYEAEFVAGSDAFIELERAQVGGREVAPPEVATRWVCRLDPGFAARGDAFGVALVGRSRAEAGRLIVGPVLALRPEGEFTAVLAQVADTAMHYGARVVTDQYSAEAVVDFLRRRGLTVRKHAMSASSKTDPFGELRVRLYEKTLELPDHADLLAELRRLQTKFRAGSAAVVNPRVGASHADMGQALALAVFELRERGRSWIPLFTPDEEPKLRRQGFVLAAGRVRKMTEAERAEHERREAEAGAGPRSSESRPWSTRTPTPACGGERR
jgi:hypothetical protein